MIEIIQDRRAKILEEAFWAKVQKTETCWLWMGATTVFGYGVFGSPTKLAHKIAIKLAGLDVPEGLYGLHKCNNKACVRLHPEHVYIGTWDDNWRDFLELGQFTIVNRDRD